jgi:hypothetical protein
MYQESTTGGRSETTERSYDTLHIHDVVCVASASTPVGVSTIGTHGPYISFKTKPDVKYWELHVMYDSIKSMLPLGSIYETQSAQGDEDWGYNDIRIALRLNLYRLQGLLIALLSLRVNEPRPGKLLHDRATDVIKSIDRMIASGVQVGSRGVTRELAVMRTLCRAFGDWRQANVGDDKEAAHERMLLAVRGVYSLSTGPRLTASMNAFDQLLRRTGLDHGYAQFSIPVNPAFLDAILQNGLTTPSLPIYLNGDQTMTLNAVDLDLDGADSQASTGFATLEDLERMKDGWEHVLEPVYIKQRVMARTASFTVDAKPVQQESLL